MEVHEESFLKEEMFLTHTRGIQDTAIKRVEDEEEQEKEQYYLAPSSSGKQKVDMMLQFVEEFIFDAQPKRANQMVANM